MDAKTIIISIIAALLAFVICGFIKCNKAIWNNDGLTDERR